MSNGDDSDPTVRPTAPRLVVEIDSSGLATATGSGEIELSDLLAVLRTIYSDSDYRYCILWDLRRCSSERLSSDDLREFANVSGASRPDGAPQGRSAVVASDELTFGLSRMAEVFLKDVPFDLRIFRSIEDARSWLLEVPAGNPPR